MAVTLANMARMAVSGAPGTGNITLGSAVAGYQSFASAGVPDGATIPYLVRDGLAWEIGRAVYTAAGTTLARTLLASSTGSLLNLTSAAIVTLSPSKDDIAQQDLFTSSAKGLAPQSGGGTLNFLRADGTWAKPPGDDYAYGLQTADYALANSTALQKLFNFSTNGALTLATGKYLFRCYMFINGMSATSGNNSFDLLGAGSATLANVFQVVEGRDGGSLNAQAMSSSGAIAASVAAPIVSAGTGTTILAVIQGYFDVTAAGTIIPSVALTTASAAVCKVGSAFECLRIGNTGVQLQGNWS